MYNKIKEITHGVYPFHMPGHKRNPEFLRECPDITEITGADDLHHPEDIILTKQRSAARLFGARYTLFSTTGSTSLIHTAISATTKSRGNIYIARNCHKSVYNAAYINSLNAGYIMPEWISELGCYGEVKPEAVEAALKKVSVDAVVITSPTYEGIVSDVKSISEICHRYGAALIVDAAHGAHLGLSEYFLPSARSLGADIVIESAHKTLPCLTGAALLHICSNKINKEDIDRAFSVFVSSSPSYPILSSITNTVRQFSMNRGDPLFRLQSDRLDELYRNASVFKALSLYRAENHDKSKIIINCAKSSIYGYELKERLLREHKIECEMATQNYVLALSTVADTALGFDRLFYALSEIDRDIEFLNLPQETTPPPQPQLKMSIRRAVESEKESLYLPRALQMVSADFVYAYPPGSPIIAPGEVITPEAVRMITEIHRSGGTVYTGTKKDFMINVVK